MKFRGTHSWKGRLRLALVVSGLLSLTAPVWGNVSASGAGAAAKPQERLQSLLDEGRYAEAETEARQLLAQVEASQGKGSLAAGHVLDLLVEALWRGGKAAEPGSRALAERAVALKERVFGPDDPQVAQSLNNLAVLLHNAGAYREAQPHYERALEILEQAEPASPPDIAATLNNLGILMGDLGDHETWKSLLERALPLQEETLGADSQEFAASLTNLATALRYWGDYSTATRYYERALAILEETLPSDHPELGTSLRDYGELLDRMGNRDGAKPILDRAREILEKTLGPNHPEVAWSLNIGGRLRMRMNDLAGAREYLERSRAIYDALPGPKHPYASYPLQVLANIHRKTGKLHEARRLMEQALAERETSYGPDTHWGAQVLGNLGDLLEQMGEHSLAIQRLERALAIQELSLDPQGPEAAESLRNLARARVGLGDTAGALRDALRAEAISSEHVRLTGRTLAEREVLRYASVRAAGLDTALALAARGLDASSNRKVWDSLIRSRALVLDEMAARNVAIRGTTDPETSRLLESLASARQRLANLVVRGPSQAHPEFYRKVVEDTRREKEQAERALVEKSATFRRDQARRRLGFTEVATALPTGSALVAFVTYGREEDIPARRAAAIPSYLAFILEPGPGKPPGVVPLGTVTEVETLVARWRQEASGGLATPGRTRDQALAAYRSAGEALRRKVWDPVVHRIGSARRVFVVPDGALNLVNLAALPAGEREYLLEKGPLIHYLSAERDLVPLPGPEQRGEGLLAVGGPDFDGAGLFATLAGKQPAPVQVASLRPSRGERSACGDFRSLRFDALPASEQEAREITSLWEKHRGAAGKTSAAELTGPLANEASFKAAAPGHRVVHVATHGFFMGGRCESALDSSRGIGVLKGVEPEEPPPLTGENPLLLSGLALAGANNREAAGPDEDDGILTAEEIAALDLSGVEWAVLSACDTGVGEVKAGEGVFGLRRALQVAGVRTVIMSLWSVEDEAAREWMRALYEGRLVKHLETAEAVRQASLKILRGRRARAESTHPFYWAGFVAAGDWK